MAYDPQSIGFISSGGNTFTAFLFSYKTSEDTLAEILVPGYFDDKTNLRVGDGIWLSTADNQSVWVRINSLNPTTVQQSSENSSDWSEFQATQTVDMANNSLTNASVVVSNQFLATVNEETLLDNKILTGTSAQIQNLNPNGIDRTVILPTPIPSLYFEIRNDGVTNNLDIEDASATSVVTIAPGIIVGILYTGTKWILV